MGVMGKTLLLLLAVFFLFLPSKTAEAYEFPLLLQERYLHLTSELGAVSLEDHLGISAFSGDFPFLVHRREGELSVYSGVPLFIPAFLSLGTVNQIGYYDSYSTHTPLSLFSAGWKAEGIFSDAAEPSGLFASWGWRSGIVSGGVSYKFMEQVPAAYLGISTRHFGAGASVSTEDLLASVTVRTDSSWSLSASLDYPWEGDPRLSIGFGFSRRDYPGDELHSRSWDAHIAHRGSLQQAPENTLAALKWAIVQDQFIGIEVDVQRTRDGEFVIIHDPVLFRYTGEFKFVSHMSYHELLSRDLGSWFSDEFAGERILHLRDFAALANRYPEIYWMIEIKSYSWSEDDVIDFLTVSESLFDHPERIVFYTLNRRLLEVMKRHTERPVGLQLDSRHAMLFFSDHILPLAGWEHARSAAGADFYTIISSKYDRYGQISQAADKLAAPVVFWNFHDTMFMHIPDFLKHYPLGLRGIDSGSILSPGSREQ